MQWMLYSSCLKTYQYLSSPETNLRPGTINQAAFKKEIHILGARDKIAIRKLFQDARYLLPPNQDIFPYSNQYLDKLKNLAKQASGESPRPKLISITFIQEIENKEGNERLQDIIEQKDLLQSKHDEWTRNASLVSTREPSWQSLEALVSHSAG